MALQPKYRGFLPGRGRTWTFDIETDGATLVDNVYEIGVNAELIYGQDEDDNILDQYLLPAVLNFEITDPNNTIWTDIRNSAQFAFSVRVYDDRGEYDIRLFLRLASSYSPYYKDRQTPITRLVGFCGLSRLKSAAGYDTTQTITLNSLFVNFLVDTLRSQDIQYLFGWRSERVGSTAPFIDAIRFGDYQNTYLDEDDDTTENAGDQLMDLLQTFQFVCFNDFIVGRRWFVGQPWLTGQVIESADRLSQYYDVSADDVAESDYPGNRLLLIADDPTLVGIYDPDYEVEIERGYEDEDVTDTLIQNGDLSGHWNTTTDNENWETDPSGALEESLGYGKLTDGGAEMTTKTKFFKKGSQILFFFEMVYAFEYTPAGSLTANFEYEIKAVPLDPAGTTYYAESGIGSGGAYSGWTATPTTLTPPLAYTPDANGTPPASLVQHTLNKNVGGAFPVDGYLEITIKGDTGNNWYLYVATGYEIDINVIDNSAPFSVWTSRFKSNEMGGNVTEGRTVSFKHKFFQGSINRGASNTIQIQADAGVLSWEDISNVRGQIVGAEGSFHDICHLLALVRLLRAPLSLRTMKGVQDGILTPRSTVYDNANAVEFIPYYTRISLHTETTEFSGYENVVELSSG